MKIGIIGTGSVASNNYIPYLSEQEDVELFYCSRTPAKAEVCAGRYGGRVCSSVESLMAQKPDTVMILTNESEHASVAERVLKCCPPRIFFEKPLFAKYGQARVCEEDFLEARSFLCRARKLGVETAMNFNYRFFDQSRTFLKLRAERKLGKLLNRKRVKVRYPARRMLFIDCDYSGSWPSPHAWKIENLIGNNGPRHLGNRGVSVCYVDGHSRARNISEIPASYKLPDFSQGYFWGDKNENMYVTLGDL